MNINLEFDSNALAAPQSFRDSVQTAANIVDAALSDPITVNVAVGYGEYGLGTSQYQQLTSNYSVGGFMMATRVSYAALVAALAAHVTSSPQAQLLASLPQAASLNGEQTFYVADAQLKALGALPATDAEVDGYTGFPTSFTGKGLVSTAIVEIVHALGVTNAGESVESLDSYTGAGTHYFGSGSAAYFSLDGGATSLASYDVGFDSTLFTNMPSAVLNVPTGVTALSNLDLEQLAANGFDIGAAVALPALSSVPTTTASGNATSVTGQNVSVLSGQAISAVAMIKSVAVPSGDAVSAYAFMNAGTDGGAFSINGVTEPANTWVYVLATELNQLQYVSASTFGTDTVRIYAITGNASTAESTGSLTVTTTLPPRAVAVTQTDGRHDFNGDHTSDFLLAQGGTIVDYLMSGGGVASGALVATGLSAYTIVGTGDFNGDGTSDILLQNGGTLVDYQMQGGTVQTGKVVTTGLTGYSVAAIGDFNGDGTSDILLQSGGTLVDYQMQAGAVQKGSVVATGLTGYTVAGAGDFNGDGTTDVLLQSGGTLVDYLLQNGGVSAGHLVAQGLTGYTVAGIGDFDHDGTSDILLQNGGTLVDYLMSGGSLRNGTLLTTGITGYTVAGTGDFNGDGFSDILLQNGGTVVDYLLGASGIQTGNALTTTATGYSLASS